MTRVSCITVACGVCKAMAGTKAMRRSWWSYRVGKIRGNSMGLRGPYGPYKRPQEERVNGIPSRELTYPTWGKGKSSSKCHFWGDMLVPRRVSYFTLLIGAPCLLIFQTDRRRRPHLIQNFISHDGSMGRLYVCLHCLILKV